MEIMSQTSIQTFNSLPPYQEEDNDVIDFFDLNGTEITNPDIGNFKLITSDYYTNRVFCNIQSYDFYTFAGFSIFAKNKIMIILCRMDKINNNLISQKYVELEPLGINNLKNTYAINLESFCSTMKEVIFDPNDHTKIIKRREEIRCPIFMEEFLINENNTTINRATDESSAKDCQIVTITNKNFSLKCTGARFTQLFAHDIMAKGDITIYISDSISGITGMYLRQFIHKKDNDGYTRLPTNINNAHELLSIIVTLSFREKDKFIENYIKSLYIAAASCNDFINNYPNVRFGNVKNVIILAGKFLPQLIN